MLHKSACHPGTRTVLILSALFQFQCMRCPGWAQALLSERAVSGGGCGWEMCPMSWVEVEMDVRYWGQIAKSHSLIKCCCK